MSHLVECIFFLELKSAFKLSYESKKKTIKYQSKLIKFINIILQRNDKQLFFIYVSLEKTKSVKHRDNIVFSKHMEYLFHIFIVALCTLNMIRL